jgi:hypothetical protein
MAADADKDPTTAVGAKPAPRRRITAARGGNVGLLPPLPSSVGLHSPRRRRPRGAGRALGVPAIRAFPDVREAARGMLR